MICLGVSGFELGLVTLRGGFGVGFGVGGADLRTYGSGSGSGSNSGLNSDFGFLAALASRALRSVSSCFSLMLRRGFLGVLGSGGFSSLLASSQPTLSPLESGGQGGDSGAAEIYIIPFLSLYRYKK